MTPPVCGYHLHPLSLPRRLLWCVVFGLALLGQVIEEKMR